MKTTFTFDEFYEYVWDYISIMVVSDDFWFKNNELLREITYNIYRYESKKNGEIQSEEFKLIIARDTAILMEVFLDMLINKVPINKKVFHFDRTDTLKYYDEIVIPFCKSIK